MTIANSTLDIINIISASVLVALSLIDNITKKSYSKINKAGRDIIDYLLFTLKKFWVKIGLIILIGIISIWVNNKKNLNNDADKTKAQKAFKKELNDRDSINQSNFNQSLTKISRASSSANAETMAKYYLKYDSAQHTIEKIVKDSIKNNYIKPEMDICALEGEAKRDTFILTASICAKKSTAYHIENNFCVVVRHNDGTLEFSPGNKFNKEKLISPDGFTITFRYFGNLASINKYYWYDFGNYRDENKKKFEYDEIRFFDTQNKRDGFLTDKEKIWIVDFIKKNGGLRK